MTKLLYGLLRYIGYAVAFPGNLLWKFGYNKYYGYVGGKVVIAGSGPVYKPSNATPIAPVVPTISAVVSATP